MSHISVLETRAAQTGESVPLFEPKFSSHLLLSNTKGKLS